MYSLVQEQCPHLPFSLCYILHVYLSSLQFHPIVEKFFLILLVFTWALVIFPSRLWGIFCLSVEQRINWFQCHFFTGRDHILTHDLTDEVHLLFSPSGDDEVAAETLQGLDQTMTWHRCDMIFFLIRQDPRWGNISSNFFEMPDGNMVTRATVYNNTVSEIINTIEVTDTVPLCFMLKHSLFTLSSYSFCKAEEHHFILRLLLK